MEIFVSDSGSVYTPKGIVDTYESFIWTERYNGIGDFQIVMVYSQVMEDLFTLGSILQIQKSDRVMIVEKVERGFSDNGYILTVKGRSVESLLMYRMARQTLTPIRPIWQFVNRTPVNFMYSILAVCVGQTASIVENRFPITRVTEGEKGGTHPSHIPGPTSIDTYDVKLVDIYTAIKNVLEEYNIGLKCYRDSYRFLDVDSSVANLNGMHMCVYTGFDKTTDIDTSRKVIFDPDLENIESVKRYRTIDAYYNQAIVYGANAVLVVNNPEFVDSSRGVPRRTLIVDATDITLPAGAALTAALDRVGRQALAEKRQVDMMDGTATQNIFEYNRDYKLGDVVLMRDLNGIESRMRVTEYIFSVDGEGLSEYPTLTNETVVLPNTWLGWPSTETWSTVSPTSLKWAEA